MTRVAVLGAGVSGLTAAYDLMRAGLDVHVVESEERAGGCIGSTVRGGYRFENGPTSIQGDNAAFLKLCHDLEITGDVVEAADDARQRYLYYHGRLTPLPRSIKEFLKSPLFTPGQKLRVMVEPLVQRGHPDREETVAEFFGRRIGRGITMTWVDVLVSGHYAGNPNRLGVRSAFPGLARLEHEHGTIFRAMREKAESRRRPDGTIGASSLITLRHGLEQLTETLRRELGERVLLRRRARALTRRPEGGLDVHVEGRDGAQETIPVDRVLMAVPAPTAGILLGPLAPDVADLLFEFEYASLAVAQVAFPREAVPGLPRGFGYLVPRSMRMRTFAWVFYSQLFPHVAPEDKVIMNGFIGGSIDPKAAEIDDASLRWLLIGELALALGQRKNPRPESFGVVRWRDALPQYNVGHLLRMTAVRQLVEMHVPEVTLAGNWVAGISIEACITRAREAALEILRAPAEMDAAAKGVAA